MQRYFRTATQLVGATALVLAGACNRDQTGPSAGGEQPLPASGAELVLAHSPARDGRVAVALRLAQRGSDPLAGLQGTLRFDPAALEFQGQQIADGAIAVVNAERARAGELRIVAFDVDGFDDKVVTLVFRAKGAAGTRGLGFETEEAVSRAQQLVRLAAPRIARQDDLAPAADAQPVALERWLDLYDKTAPRSFDLNGQYQLNLVYGNANLSGGVTIGDALVIAQISGNSRELIIGTDAPNTDPIVAGNVFPGSNADLTTVGVNANGTRSISVGDALAIAQGAAGSAPATSPVGQLIPGRGPRPGAGDTITVSGDITASVTWGSANIWKLVGTVRVTNGAVLTIAPGTTVAGQDDAALFIERDGRIIADGTYLQPIRFTCTLPDGAKTKGCWRGLFIAGNAPLNEPTPTSGALAGTSSPTIPGRATGGCFQDQGEGNGPIYGGCNAADDSGILRYVIVEYGGFTLSDGNELNNLTLAGVGSGTVLDYIQTHAGKDDGFEVFGGTFDVKHLYLTANQDDQLDWTQGWAGRAQFVIVQMDPLDSDNGIEGDNAQRSANRGNFANGRTNPRVWNYTFVGQDNPADNSNVAGEQKRQGMHIRRGSAGQLVNGIVFNMRVALDLDDAANNTCQDINTANGVWIRSSIFAGNQLLGTAADLGSGTDPVTCGPYSQATDGDVGISHIIDPANGNFVNPAGFAMRAPLNKQTPDYRPLVSTTGLTPPNDGFFEQVSFIGAVPATPATTAPWYLGWVRTWQGATP